MGKKSERRDERVSLAQNRDSAARPFTVEQLVQRYRELLPEFAACVQDDGRDNAALLAEILTALFERDSSAFSKIKIYQNKEGDAAASQLLRQGRISARVMLGENYNIDHRVWPK